MRTIKSTFEDEPILLTIVAIILAVAALWAVGCGSNGAAYPPANPAAASGTPAPTGTPAATVNIVGTVGSTSFTPNPVQASSGGTLAFKNTTSVIHHIVMDDGTVIGDVAVGATLNTTVKGSGGNYHCTTHPTMVGSINGASAPPDPTPNSSGGYDY